MVIALSVIGVVTVTSVDETLRNKQIMGIAMGVGVMIVLSLIDYTLLLKLYWVTYAVTLALLVAVEFYGHESHGAERWLNIGGFITIQPSEIAKIMLIFFFAQFIMRYREKVETLWFVLLCVLILAPVVVLVILQPDMSTSIMLVVIFACTLFTGGIDRRIVVGVLLLILPAAILVIYSASWEDSPFLTTYQQGRILAWLHPEDYADGDAYQTLNSMMAIGSGQLSGKGVNNNEITSVLNSGYISESQNDFIFTVIGEEMGFIGATAVVILIGAISVKCMLKASRAKDLSGRVICAGVGSWICFQGFLNIAVATGIAPNTGIPLPFVSSGLTSIICVYMGIGFVLNVGLQGRQWFY